MHKADDLDPGDPNFDKKFERSIYVEGTFDPPGAPPPEAFKMWHDTGENFDLSGPNGFDVLPGQTGNDRVVDFKLRSLLNHINFATSVDPLDINPGAANNADKDIADPLKDNIQAAADFGKDEDGDGVISEDEDVD